MNHCAVHQKLHINHASKGGCTNKINVIGPETNVIVYPEQQGVNLIWCEAMPIADA